MANEMYEYIIEKCRESVDEVQTGEFGADMKVQLLMTGHLPFCWIQISFNLTIKLK